jgi:hypothetical protein
MESFGKALCVLVGDMTGAPWACMELRAVIDGTHLITQTGGGSRNNSVRLVHIFILATFLIGCLAGAAALRAWQKAKPFILTSVVESEGETQTALLAHAPQTDIVMLGDSITEGAPWSLILPCRSVANLGRSGDTSEGVLMRIADVIHLGPKSVFLMIGANDIGFRTSSESTVENILAISRQLAEHSTVYWHPILPINGAEQIVADLNRRIEAVTAPFVQKVPLPIDRQDLKDGLHLKASGYVKWRETIAGRAKHNCQSDNAN